LAGRVLQNARVQLDEFAAILDALTAYDLHRIARALDLDSLADEVDWWRATIAIDRAIRQRRCTRQAARAAATAAELVRASALRAGFELPDRDVTKVARAAAEVARGLTAGPGAQGIVRLLLEPWAPVATVG